MCWFLTNICHRLLQPPVHVKCRFAIGRERAPAAKTDQNRAQKGPAIGVIGGPSPTQPAAMAVTTNSLRHRETILDFEGPGSVCPARGTDLQVEAAASLK